MQEHLLGGIDPLFFLACVIYAGFGILLVLLMGTTLRATTSDNSPREFSWKYLMNDNTRRILASGLATLMTLRFMTELTGWELSMWKAFVIGTGWDGISLFIKQKTSWLDKK